MRWSLRTGRRPVFFAFVGLVSLALAPAAPPEFRWVNYVMGALAAFWAILLALEVLAGRGRGERSAGCHELDHGLTPSVPSEPGARRHICLRTANGAEFPATS